MSLNYLIFTILFSSRNHPAIYLIQRMNLLGSTPPPPHDCFRYGGEIGDQQNSSRKRKRRILISFISIFVCGARIWRVWPGGGARWRYTRTSYQRKKKYALKKGSDFASPHIEFESSKLNWNEKKMPSSFSGFVYFIFFVFLFAKGRGELYKWLNY